VIVERPADEVWARISDFGDVGWVPNTESCQLVGDVRRIRMVGMSFDIVERLLEQDESGRRQRYDLVNPEDLAQVLGPDHPVRGLVGTLHVQRRGDAACWVTWDVDTDEFMVAAVRDEYQGGLDNLKLLLGG
jgi:hypothetical protein